MDLAHTAVDRVLRDAGIRGLFIKGPILTAQALREPHASVDVDVLVDPARYPDILALLAAHRWFVAVHLTAARTLPLHSTTLRHPSWALEIDVHDRFPGFLADPQTVFESLWAHRTTVNLAGRYIPCLSPVAHSAVAALHWLRDPNVSYNEERLSYLTQAVRPILDEDARAALGALAVATGSTSTLAPFLRSLDVRVPPGWYDDSMWRMRTASTGVKSIPWLVELRRTSIRRMPRRLAHALLLTESEIRRAQPDAAPGAWGLFRARLRRIRWGLHDLPKAMQIVWRESRRK